MNKIDSFKGPYRFLSNFYPAEVELDGVKYPSVEHAYQARKTNVRVEREIILNAKKASQAKALGQSVTKIEEWDEIKVDVMKELIRKKFYNKVLRAELLDTGDAELSEGNWWNDTFWGVCKGRGKNMLGKILMEVRKEIREEMGT